MKFLSRIVPEGRFPEAFSILLVVAPAVIGGLVVVVGEIRAKIRVLGGFRLPLRPFSILWLRLGRFAVRDETTSSYPLHQQLGKRTNLRSNSTLYLPIRRY